MPDWAEVLEEIQSVEAANNSHSATDCQYRLENFHQFR